MEQFAEDLRKERERKQITLDAICAVTKVSIRHLEALEAGNYTDLPGGVFRKGIVRSYLHALNLEETLWLERFESVLRERGALEPHDNDWAEFAENIRRNRGGVEPSNAPRWFGVAMMAGTVVALGWGVWKFVLHGRLFL
jgi:cytoskeleton protein RodZ